MDTQNETKVSASCEVRERLQKYCRKHGLKQFWLVNKLISDSLDLLERQDEKSN